MKEIILDAPGKNALSTELISAVRAALATADGEPVLLTGARDAFSAGLNLKEVRAFDANSAATFLRELAQLVLDLFHYPGPTVALINGHAIAGGCVLALCADYRVMRSDLGAKIGLNETAIGLPLPPVVAKLCRARLPTAHVERLVLGAELHDAEDALALGLVDEISEGASALAGQRLAALAAHPSQAYLQNKRMLRAGALECSAEELARFERQGLPIWASEATKAMVDRLLKPKA
ncbi:MAG: enoyl-CoA hydratase/isomerase family protein [Polyangiaceae bacterium]